jgi:putative serine protease PepD
MFCKNCGQKTEKGTKFCKNCGIELPGRENVFHHALGWLKEYKGVFILLAIVIVIIVIASSIDSTNNEGGSYDTSYSNASSQTAPATTVYNTQNKIASSVVNIICPDGTEEGLSGGSGTIMTSDGLILTNSHIIPQNNQEEPLTDYCLVTLPDEKGKAKEIYYGKPLVIPSLSNEYDLAFVNIEGAYVDEDGISQGRYPNNFQGFLKDICENDDVSLGEPVRVFGYPTISGGGYFLTVTDGVVSSIPNDGTIVTSAKIDHGNSGGIAVDGNGCFIGVPAMAETGTIESLGIIISNKVVLDFMTKLNTLMDN